MNIYLVTIRGDDKTIGVFSSYKRATEFADDFDTTDKNQTNAYSQILKWKINGEPECMPLRSQNTVLGKNKNGVLVCF